MVKGLTRTMERDIIMAQKEYVSPEIEIIEVYANDGNRCSLPYGIAKGLGLDTTGMNTKKQNNKWSMCDGKV